VTRTKPVNDHDRLLGTGLGALVGGVPGHQIGGGSGKTLATVAGAAAGGYTGNQIQQKTQQADTYITKTLANHKPADAYAILDAA
jgi:uncharacterized protein YcfJ